MRYKRVLTPGKPGESQNEREACLKKFSRLLLNREISCESFKDILVEQGVNPKAETLNRILRQHDLGTPTKFDELYNAIQKFDTDLDPSRMQVEIKAPKFNGESINEHDQFMKNFAPKKDGLGVMYLAAKKNVYSKYNCFNSNKDVFDWESNELGNLKIKASKAKDDLRTDSRWHKIIHESKVFNSDVPKTSKYYLDNSTKNNVNETNNMFIGSGNFLTWNDDMRGSLISKNNELKRKNPNEIRNEIVQEKVLRKLNTMHLSSKENTLTIDI